MTATTTTSSGLPSSAIRARKAGFLADMWSVAGRALRAIPREPEALAPPLVIPVFFYVVNIGQLQEVAERMGGGNFKAFQLPVAILFAVTGISRASALTVDIQSGYFDRLLTTPVKRRALLLGLMVADFALVVGLCLPVLLLGWITGVEFETGPLGVLAFLLLSGVWAVAFTGIPYAIALKTGSAAAVNSSFLLFFPFLFLTTTYLPREALTGWLDTVAGYNPVTYLLAAQRSLISGWDGRDVLEGLLAVAVVGIVSQAMAFAALRSRVAQR